MTGDMVPPPIPLRKEAVVPGPGVGGLDHDGASAGQQRAQSFDRAPRIGNVLDDLLQDDQREGSLRQIRVLEPSERNLEPVSPRSLDCPRVELDSVAALPSHSGGVEDW